MSTLVKISIGNHSTLHSAHIAVINKSWRNVATLWHFAAAEGRRHTSLRRHTLPAQRYGSTEARHRGTKVQKYRGTDAHRHRGTQPGTEVNIIVKM